MKKMYYAGLLLTLLTLTAFTLPASSPLNPLVPPPPTPRIGLDQLVATSWGWMQDDTLQQVLAWLKDGGIFTRPMPGQVPELEQLPAPTATAWPASTAYPSE